MAARSRCFGRLVAVALLGSVLSAASGCGYLKNLRDDFNDCFILGAGIVTPVAPTSGGNQAVGPLPPSIGIYAEATEFLHLGALYKASADLEWDRRGMSIVADERAKIGLGPLHYVNVTQKPIIANAYKVEGNQMDGWRQHMRSLTDPVFSRPAKELIFESPLPEPFLQRGWQDWEVISLEVAIPEPFLLHSGLNVRAGVDPSQIFDFVLGIFCIDLYDDNAFTFGGDLQFPVEQKQQ